MSLAAAVANRRRDAIRRMTVRPAVASRVETNQAAARIRVASKVETNPAADKKKADRTKRPDIKVVLSKPKAHARFPERISFVSLIY